MRLNRSRAVGKDVYATATTDSPKVWNDETDMFVVCCVEEGLQMYECRATSGLRESCGVGEFFAQLAAMQLLVLTSGVARSGRFVSADRRRGGLDGFSISVRAGSCLAARPCRGREADARDLLSAGTGTPSRIRNHRCGRGKWASHGQGITRTIDRTPVMMVSDCNDE